jgi:hypothetical protein
MRAALGRQASRRALEVAAAQGLTSNGGPELRACAKQPLSIFASVRRADPFFSITYPVRFVKMTFCRGDAPRDLYNVYVVNDVDVLRSRLRRMRQPLAAQREGRQAGFPIRADGTPATIIQAWQGVGAVLAGLRRGLAFTRRSDGSGWRPFDLTQAFLTPSQHRAGGFHSRLAFGLRSDAPA